MSLKPVWFKGQLYFLHLLLTWGFSGHSNTPFIVNDFLDPHEMHQHPSFFRDSGSLPLVNVADYASQKSLFPPCCPRPPPPPLPGILGA